VATDKAMKGYARDCVRLAGMTDDPEVRDPLLKMAREWMETARGEQPRVKRIARASKASTSQDMSWSDPQTGCGRWAGR
jgi:hypothetical protein